MRALVRRHRPVGPGAGQKRVVGPVRATSLRQRRIGLRAADRATRATGLRQPGRVPTARPTTTARPVRIGRPVATGARARARRAGSLGLRPVIEYPVIESGRRATGAPEDGGRTA